MNTFKEISPYEIDDNIFKMIGKDWMLISSANREGKCGGKDYNTMTASWGGVGFLWKKPVVFVFIRPQRHTFGFAEENDRLTLSFFEEDFREALSFCGKESGRDYDKAKECGLTPVFDTNESGRAVWFDEAKIVIKTKKLYGDWLNESAFTDQSPLVNYKAGDFHKMYVCEIEEVLVKQAL